MKKLKINNTEMKTLVACINSLVNQGFIEDFKVMGDQIKALKRERFYVPSEVKILNFYRFEGDSDPADNSILYAIETNDGIRGTLVDAYGPYADSTITSFLSHVSKINKKTNRERFKDIIKIKNMKTENGINSAAGSKNRFDAAMIFKYASLLALIFSTIFIIALIFHVERVVWLRFINYMFYFPAAFFAIKKNYSQEDKIDYFNGLVIGFLTCFIGQIIYSFLFFIYLHFDKSLVAFISSQMPTQLLLYPELSISFVLAAEGFAWSAIIAFASMQFFKSKDGRWAMR